MQVVGHEDVAANQKMQPPPGFVDFVRDQREFVIGQRSLGGQKIRRHEENAIGGEKTLNVRHVRF